MYDIKKLVLKRINYICRFLKSNLPSWSLLYNGQLLIAVTFGFYLFILPVIQYNDHLFNVASGHHLLVIITYYFLQAVYSQVQVRNLLTMINHGNLPKDVRSDAGLIKTISAFGIVGMV